ncbi:hypothetical protein JW979_04010 [bacterium]|nr:hypothetical protein [candidate division CSSED10-310 bacterium]
MTSNSLWRRFWSPKGKGYGLFFLKFFIFTGIAFFCWMGIRSPYNRLLKTVSTGIANRSLPVIHYRFDETNQEFFYLDTLKNLRYRIPLVKAEKYWPQKDNGILYYFNPETGDFAVRCWPYRTGPLMPKKNEPVTANVSFNTAHYNIIPFLALLLASPFLSWKRLITFLVIGFLFLSLGHIIHIYLSLNYSYFKYQEDNNYFPAQTVEMTDLQQQQYSIWKYKFNALKISFGIMDQAGSMIIPAFIWFVYASRWILKALLSGQSVRETSRDVSQSNEQQPKKKSEEVREVDGTDV